jgi:hypothetical protein
MMHKPEEFFNVMDGRTRSKKKRDRDIIDAMLKAFEELYGTN